MSSASPNRLGGLFKSTVKQLKLAAISGDLVTLSRAMSHRIASLNVFAALSRADRVEK